MRKTKFANKGIAIIGGAFSFCSRGGTGDVPKLFCNKAKCEFNHDHECTAAIVHYVGKMCMTYHQTTTAALMRKDDRPRCHREGGKYKSNGGRLFK